MKNTPSSKSGKPKLSRSQLLLKYDYIQELKRRKKEKREAYHPNEGQDKVHRSDATIRCVFSGNGAGKTALGANEADWSARGYNPLLETFRSVPSKTIVVLDLPDKVEDLWKPEIEKWTNTEHWEWLKNGKPYINEAILPNGSSIKFMFHQQPELAFESIEADFFIFDEPPPRHVWIGLLRAGRKKNRIPKYLFLGTPITGSWMREEFLDPWARGERPDIECFKYGTVVNEKNLAHGYVQNMTKNLSDKEKRTRLEGEFFDLEGLALSHLFKRHIHVVQSPPEIVLAVIAIDPHPEKNHVACLIGAAENGALYYLDEVSTKQVPREFADNLRYWKETYPVFDIVCDSYGNTPMTGGEGNRSFIEVLKSEGIPVRATSYEDKKDDSWIVRIHDVLEVRNRAAHGTHSLTEEEKEELDWGFPEQDASPGVEMRPGLYIVEGNNGILKDIENVSWLKQRAEDANKPKLDLTKRDFLSCLKYALATSIHPKKKKSQVYRPTRLPGSYGSPKKSNKPLRMTLRRYIAKRSK